MFCSGSQIILREYCVYVFYIN